MLWVTRIFVNLAMVPAQSQAERDRLLLMARKLLRFTTLIALPALGFGLWLWLGWGIGQGSGWLPTKLVVVAAAVVYHFACARVLRQFERSAATRGHVWFRWFNEIPVLLLLAAVVLAVVKPF